jgi:hypothetical protein
MSVHPQGSYGIDAPHRHNLGWRMWWSGPWLPTVLVSARRPDLVKAPQSR